MIRLFTAAFGDAYVSAARALLRSIARYSPRADVTVFTDRPGDFTHPGVQAASLVDLLAELDQDFSRLQGQRHNAFKFALFERMRRLHPNDDLCWIDADMLVLDDLPAVIRPGHVNVMAHGRRGGQMIACGDGLDVPGERYAIGGLYSLPPGGAEAFLRQKLAERDSWSDMAPLVRHSGDQVTLNHLVARSGLPVHWLTDDLNRIYNLEVGESLHPVVGDPGLARISLEADRLERDGRRIAVFCWIKSRLDAHLADGFATFRPDVARFLADLYTP